MRKLIFIIGMLTVGFITANILGGFVRTNEYTGEATTAEYGENNRLVELSKRVEIDAFIDEKYIEDSEFDDEADIIYTDTGSDNHFKVSEFVKYDPYASNETIRKIKEIHIPELQKVRDGLNKAIIIRSAARSVAWEKKQDRSGKSQHVYANGLGAVDVSVRDYNVKTLDTLENAIMDLTDYNRITRYDSFIHLDFAENRFGDRAYYRNTQYGWIYIGKVK